MSGCRMKGSAVYDWRPAKRVRASKQVRMETMRNLEKRFPPKSAARRKPDPLVEARNK